MFQLPLTSMPKYKGSMEELHIMGGWDNALFLLQRNVLFFHSHMLGYTHYYIPQGLTAGKLTKMESGLFIFEQA